MFVSLRVLSFSLSLLSLNEREKKKEDVLEVMKGEFF